MFIYGSELKDGENTVCKFISYITYGIMLNGNTNRHQYLFKSKFFSTQRYKMSLFLREKKYTEPALIPTKYGTGTNRIFFSHLQIDFNFKNKKCLFFYTGTGTIRKSLFRPWFILLNTVLKLIFCRVMWLRNRIDPRLFCLLDSNQCL